MVMKRLAQKLKLKLFKRKSAKHSKSFKNEKEMVHCEREELTERVNTLRSRLEHLKRSQEEELKEMKRLNELMRRAKERLMSIAQQTKEATERCDKGCGIAVHHLENKVLKLQGNYQELLHVARIHVPTQDDKPVPSVSILPVPTCTHHVQSQWTMNDQCGGPAFVLKKPDSETEQHQRLLPQHVQVIGNHSVQAGHGSHHDLSHSFNIHDGKSDLHSATGEEVITAEDREVEAILTGVPDAGQYIREFYGYSKY